MYIGETGRSALIRKKEHEKDFREINMRSAISEHSHRVGHRPNFDSFKIICREKDWTRRRIREGVEIMRHRTFNRDDGIRLDRKWKRLLVK